MNPKVRYDTGGVSIAFDINTCPFCYPFLLLLFGVAVRGKASKATLKILALASPQSEKPKVRYVRDFNLGSFT